jgi:AcrR family transcriptional regulator
VGGRRARRHALTRAEILDAAWDIVRAEGLAGLTMRDLARRVGMRAPSLYSYFASKHEIYDAMFAQGYRQFIERWEELEQPDDPRDFVVAGLRLFVEFAVEDPARHQLLFQRTVPGFEPSAESWAVAQEAYERTLVAPMRAIGITDPHLLDMATALGTGLADQQISNDPGGDRWLRLIDEAAEMFLARALPTKHR